jgi:hypothetical protein
MISSSSVVMMMSQKFNNSIIATLKIEYDTQTKDAEQYLVSLVRNYFQERFGSKEVAERWDMYFTRLFRDNLSWFVENNLTPHNMPQHIVSDVGTTTAAATIRRPAAAVTTVERVVQNLAEKNSTWNILWDLVVLQ